MVKFTLRITYDGSNLPMVLIYCATAQSKSPLLQTGNRPNQQSFIMLILKNKTSEHQIVTTVVNLELFSSKTWSLWQNFQSTPCPKINGPPASNMPNSVCSSWISTKYRTLHYLNITYCYTHYDVHTSPCVLNVTSLWHQSFFTLRYVQCIVIHKGIKQQRIRLRVRACVEAKCGHFKLKL